MEILHLLDESKSNLTQIRAIAKEIGKNQPMADALWESGGKGIKPGFAGAD